MSFITKLVLLPALLSLVKSDLPLLLEEVDIEAVYRNEFDPTTYRVPENIDPIHFDVEITPYFEDTATREAFSFDGEVTMRFRAIAQDISTIVIQENVREILSISVTTINGIPVLVNETNPFERIRAYHFLRINLRDGVTLVNGEEYLLTIAYIGNINETPLSRGVFRGSYRGDDGRVRWYVTTHLQPTNARQAFPCLDEPGFKSTFNIIVNRPANFTQTFSNMRIAQTLEMGDRVKEIFETTPRMSAYLVTIHISEDFRVIADNNDEARSYRIIARPNAADQGGYALEVGPPVTKWLEDYLGIEYYTMAENIKNDQIAAPAWASGATENWGLVSYRELRLLYEEGETNAVDRMSIGTITAHELAHKWFGNLITARWWDNVWVNEGFASYFEYFAMDAVDPSMELADQFVIMYVQSALSADSSASTRALQHPVNSPSEVTGHFSGISYSKGASLLLMLKHFVTEDTFRKALNLFLVDRSYDHAFPEDLASAFAVAVAEDNIFDSNFDMRAFIMKWVEEPGYPVIKVDIDMNTGEMNLRQERFFISASPPESDTVWPLPLTYTTGNNPNWNNLRSTEVMTERTHTIQKSPGHEWVIFNVQQQGLYRVDYDTHNWEMLANALTSDLSSIHYLNRAQIVDDVFALMRSQRMSYDLGFQVLQFLKQDVSYYTWYPAITGFNWLRNRFLHLPDALAEFDEILNEFLDTVVNELGYTVRENEPLTTTLNRFYLLTFACNIGHRGCIEDSIEKFNEWRAGSVARINPNIRRHVLCEGLRNGDYNDWRFVYLRRVDSNNQAAEVGLLRALGCSTDEQAVQDYLRMILSDDVRAQDTVNAFTFLYMGDRRNANVALQFLKENIDAIRTAVVLPAWFNSVLSNLASYLNEEGLEDMENWLQENQASIPEASVGLSAITSARNNMQWGTENAHIVLRAARGSATVILPTTVLLLSAIVTLMFK